MTRLYPSAHRKHPSTSKPQAAPGTVSGTWWALAVDGFSLHCTDPGCVVLTVCACVLWGVGGV